MRQSQYFLKTSKTVPAGDPSVNAQLLERGGFIYKNSAGIYSFLPLGWRVMQKIAGIIREEMNGIGGQELFMPALHDQRYLKATGRWDVGVVFKIAGEKGQPPAFNISWTHEEVMSEIASKFVSSYRDLPFATYQIQTKFRNEPRAKSGLLRGREFMMKDLYSFHADEADLNRYYDVVAKAYTRVFERSGLKAYFTLAAGGDFTTDYTHEFQVVCEAGEDRIYLCAKCELAENQEISKLKVANPCPKCGGLIEEKKAIEVGNIFRYGDKYSKPFDLHFTDEKGVKKYVTTGAYGIGLGRLLATIVEISHDDKGIIWPNAVSPFDFHLITLDASESGVLAAAESLYLTLQAKGASVLFDDRDVSAGVKFADADLIGISQRLVVSKKTLAQASVEVKERATGKIEMKKFNQLT